MHIGLGGHIYSVPPRLYGGVERVVAWWAEELMQRDGYEVTIFGTGDSTASCSRLIDCTAQTPDRFGPWFQAFEDCDVIHDNNDGLPTDIRWTRKDGSERPYIFTVHACVKHDMTPNPVFLSYNQARFFHHENPVVCTNGFPIENFKVREDKEDFLLWCGSLRGCKAPEMGVQLAQDTGERLKIIGPIQDGDYVSYRQRFPKGGQIEYLGEMGAERMEYFARAKAFIYTFSDNWMEGLNLVLCEALLCGTPVIGLHRPNNTIVDEVYQDGVGGVICPTYEDMVKAVKDKSYVLPAEQCRAEGEKHSIQKTVDRYLEIYEMAIKGPRW